MLERLVENMADKMSTDSILEKEWEDVKKHGELGGYIVSRSVYLPRAYALLAKGAISKEEFLESIKIGAEYYKSEKFIGELGRKRRTIEADEILKQIRKKSVTEVMGYKIPEQGDVMLIESTRYVGFCTPSAAKQYFPKQESGSKYEITLPTSLELDRFERRFLEINPAELHIFPKMKPAR
jgi:hypothetical protein